MKICHALERHDREGIPGYGGTATSEKHLRQDADDRIEFFNPGQLLEELTIEKVISGNYRSHLRNKQIANMFKEAGLIEKYGSGIKRVIETCKKWGMLTPIFECTEKGFLVTVFKSENREKVGEKVGEKYSENQKLIIRYIQENNTISAKDLSDRVGISSRKVEENIKKLKQVGKLRRILASIKIKVTESNT